MENLSSFTPEEYGIAGEIDRANMLVRTWLRFLERTNTSIPKFLENRFPDDPRPSEILAGIRSGQIFLNVDPTLEDGIDSHVYGIVMPITLRGNKTPVYTQVTIVAIDIDPHATMEDLQKIEPTILMRMYEKHIQTPFPFCEGDIMQKLYDLQQDNVVFTKKNPAQIGRITAQHPVARGITSFYPFPQE